MGKPTELAQAIKDYIASLVKSPTDNIDEIRKRPEVAAHIHKLEQEYLKE
ncbi:hypothetical protein LCGC14_2799690 [marine sediment metagenome]|uniref:Uncharacterized protein n=1 Tax=marine sediment metagenome TaxID=412755 RepID=A0A0F8YN59_9ZZZZ